MKDMDKLKGYAMAHGRVVTIRKDRRWWNPMRYILGKRFLKHIPERKMRKR